MENRPLACQSLASAITKEASKQTYYTIRFLVDRDLEMDAYLAYAYFRWVDDILDAPESTRPEKIKFISRQKSLLHACFRGEFLNDLSLEEKMLVELVCHDRGDNPGLHSYLKNMMAILEFDAKRRGHLITKAELSLYSQGLAAAVTDAMHYFIGYEDPAPDHESRYSAVKAAHITHMLRDALDDIELGYFNIPREYLLKNNLSPKDVNDPAYRSWVCSQVKLARSEFTEGRKSLAQINNFRCRLVGFAYTARFEWMLRIIEKEYYCLRSEYRERKGIKASLWMGWSTISSLLLSSFTKPKSSHMLPNRLPIKDS